MSGMVLVAVVGGSSCSEAEAAMAQQVGELLAKAGVGVVCGGGGGVMEAACRGAAKHAGLTVGVLPGLRPDEANEHVAIAVPTGLGQARNAVVAAAGAAMIAVGGSFGTLSEVALALRYGRPVIGLATWDVQNGSGEAAPIHHAANPEDAVELALQSIGGRSQHD